MATKKAAPKKVVKSAKPVKPARPSGGKVPAKTASKPKTASVNNKKAAVKPAAKKSVAAKPIASSKKHAKPAPAKKPVKQVVPVKKKPAAPASKKPAPAPVKAVHKPAHQPAVKPVAKHAPTVAVAKKPEPAPVKKHAVEAPSHKEMKPAIKPLAQPPVKKEPAKPAKPFVIPKTSTTRSVKYNPEFTKSVLDTNKHYSEQHSGPTQRYSDAELAEFRDLINRKLDTAKKELAYLQGLITRKDESGDLDEGRYMTMEDGSMSMEREQLSQMASRQIQFIDHLEKAIMRIENKTYGICRVTGKLIDKARLRAVPHATLSIEAKQMMNK
jgi:RNA polymerase-binding transcription factor DksA